MAFRICAGESCRPVRMSRVLAVVRSCIIASVRASSGLTTA
jgi:hypothetical protein